MKNHYLNMFSYHWTNNKTKYENGCYRYRKYNNKIREFRRYSIVTRAGEMF